MLRFLWFGCLSSKTTWALRRNVGLVWDPHLRLLTSDVGSESVAASRSSSERKKQSGAMRCWQNTGGFSSQACATEEVAQGAAKACGRLVGVWQPRWDVIVTSGNAAMPAPLSRAAGLKPPSSFRILDSGCRCTLPPTLAITRSPSCDYTEPLSS